MIQTYNLNLVPLGNIVNVRCSQYDKISRTINMIIYNGNVLYSIPEGSVVTVRGTKPKDNTGFEYQCTFNGSVVAFDIQDQMTIYAGKIPAEIRIVNNDTILGSANFFFLVEPAPLTEDTVISETQLPLLESAVQAAAKLEEAFDDIAEFTDETYPNAVQAIQNEGATQVANVTNEGTTQKGLVTSEGNTQVANVQAKGDEVIASIPSDYIEMIDKLDKVADATTTSESVQTTINLFPEITWTNGYVALNGQGFDSSTLRRSQKLSVNEGDVLNYTNTNFTFRFITAYIGDTAVSAKGAEAINSYTVPEGIDGVIISDYISKGDLPINYTYREVNYTNIYADEISSMSEDISNAQTELEAIKEAITFETYREEQVTEIVPTFTAGAMDERGNTYEYTSFQYTQKIAVSEGDIVNAVMPNETNASMRWLCAFSGDTVVPASGASDDRKAYIVPSGIDGVVITVRVANAVSKIRINSTVQDTSAYVKPIPMGFMAEKGSLSDGDSLTLPYHNVKINNCYIFNANISSFSKIKFTKGGNTLEVNDTNIVITNDGDSPTIPHGLTITDNISLIVENETSTNTSLIRVASNGVEFSYTTPVRFVLDGSTPTITSDGSVLTECTFSWVSKNINAPIWMFGDSYFSWYVERWTYYLARDGYTKSVMLNGYAGQASDTAYNALSNLLQTTVPKMVVWCLGMNNGDSDSAVNDVWNSYYEKVVELSKKYGFELVLYTTPTTPTIQNDFKNAIVRASGYRYLECDKAVRIDGTRNWVTGALDVDDVHPTAIGAKILYYRILADLPELMSNY